MDFDNNSVGECDESEMDPRVSADIQEILAKVNMNTSLAVKQRLAARSLEMQFEKLLNEKSNDFVPPKQLLIYLVRMGSFTSAPKILNDDHQDNDIILPNSISRQELLQLCKNQPKVFPMVKRSFRRLDDDIMDAVNHKFKHLKLNIVSKANDSYISDLNLIRVFQWNVLSQALGQMNDNFVRCPDEALEWKFRRFQIVEEIVEYCPDIICLQEVDHFNFLKNVLDTQDYSGTFFPKPDSPCLYINGNNGPDGCAIFFKRNKFELLKVEKKILEIWKVQSNQVVLMAILRVRETDQEICVATTHLKARNGTLLSTLRNEQGKDLLNFVSSHCGERPIILCGDFNAEPTEPVYDTIIGYNPLNLSSAYADCQNLKITSALREPPYTTWKIRDEGEVCHTIDYIFYSKNKLEVDGVLEFPTGEEIGEGRVPSFSYPSDHFSLVCDFKIAPTAK